MLSKERRLPGKNIPLVKKQGLRISTLLATSLFTRTKNTSFRATVSVSSKVSKLATERNHLKRKFRHALSHSLSLFPQNIDLVIIPQKASLNASFSQIKKDIETLLRQLSRQ